MVWSVNISLNAWRNLFGKTRCRQKVKWVRWISTPVYDAQDTDIKKFSLRKSKSGKDEAEVIASFENMGHKTEITYSLVLTKMGWTISNIKYADGRNLIGLLSAK
jgi:hypothetical protein